MRKKRFVKKFTLNAFADIGSHGGIFEFRIGPVGKDYPGLLHIYREKANDCCVPCKITYTVKK